jgi:hypothetical protein
MKDNQQQEIVRQINDLLNNYLLNNSENLDSTLAQLEELLKKLPEDHLIANDPKILSLRKAKQNQPIYLNQERNSLNQNKDGSVDFANKINQLQEKIKTEIKEIFDDKNIQIYDQNNHPVENSHNLFENNFEQQEDDQTKSLVFDVKESASEAEKKNSLEKIQNLKKSFLDLSDCLKNENIPVEKLEHKNEENQIDATTFAFALPKIFKNPFDMMIDNQSSKINLMSLNQNPKQDLNLFFITLVNSIIQPQEKNVMKLNIAKYTKEFESKFLKNPNTTCSKPEYDQISPIQIRF